MLILNQAVVTVHHFASPSLASVNNVAVTCKNTGSTDLPGQSQSKSGNA